MRTKEKFYSHEQFFKLFAQFVRDTARGKRLKKDGKKIRNGTIENYTYCHKLVQKFVEHSGFEIKLYLVNKLSNSEKERVKKYWKKFYKDFTDYLYFELDFYDNYVGNIIKSLRTFFTYLNNECNLQVGNYYKLFYVPHEDIPIVALSPEQLNYLIYDQGLNDKLPEHLRKTKDIFVFGCTVALRQSDLLGLTKQNLHHYNNGYYIKVDSQKTNTHTTIKLPPYAVDILKKYHDGQKTLLPAISKARFNLNLKELGRYMELKEPMIKYREKRGQKYMVYKNKAKKTHYTLADHLTTHTMRRTAITTMLRLNMPEQVVRSISGHAPNSKEFFRYVEFAQGYIDEHTDKVFEKISAMKQGENVLK